MLNRSITTSISYLATDLAALLIAAAFAWWIKSLADPSLSLALYLRAIPYLLLSTGVVYGMLGLYPGIGRSAADELRRLTQGTTIVVAGAMVVTFLGQTGVEWSRQVFAMTWILALPLVPVSRAMVRRLFCKASWWGVPVAVIGAGVTGEQVIGLLKQRPWLGLKPMAIFDDSPERRGQQVLGVTVSGKLSEISDVRRQNIHHAILAIPSLPADRLSQVLDHLGNHLRHVYISPALPGSPDVIAETREFNNTLVLEVRQNLLRAEVCFLKRVLDLTVVVIGLLLTWWILVGIAFMVKISSSGPIFYGQNRLGRGGREFKAWKFRSMVKDADAALQHYLAEHPELHEEWERDHKLKRDPRVTWIGSILRRTSLDELPQLWNILRGDMSLVGPRPIVQSEVPKYGDRYALYLKVRPGLSGLWQVSGRNDTTYAERVALDCYYVRNWTVWLDLVILARTVRVVLWGKGAY